ncbi:hypothetical protein SALWKB2_2236 [Snodgrassella alvi wkB2]|nr:hypothetical protein SALWKB2_2236 [Snodgrassella alvi wkB2]
MWSNKPAQPNTFTEPCDNIHNGCDCTAVLTACLHPAQPSDTAN